MPENKLDHLPRTADHLLPCPNLLLGVSGFDLEEYEKTHYHLIIITKSTTEFSDLN